MSTRKIKVLSTVGISGTIETNVETLGELKPLLEQKDINYDGMKMMVGETRNELSMDEATLPTGDFKLYLMPSKTKSGGFNTEDTLDKISDLFASLSEEFSDLAIQMSTKDMDRSAKSEDALSAEDRAAMEDLRRISEESDKGW